MGSIGWASFEQKISAIVLYVQHQALTAIDTLNIRIDTRESERIRCVHHDIIARILDPRAQSVSARAGRNIWQSVCTSIHTRAHTSMTTSICSILDLSSDFKPHKYSTYVFNAQKINISKRLHLIRGISSSRSSRRLADGCVRA